MNIDIRLAKKEDAVDLVKYFRENDPNFIEKFITNRINYYIDNSFISIVKDNKKLIGHLFFQVTETPKLGVGEFETVNIHENYREKGIGTKLIKKSIEFSRDYFENQGIKLRCLYLKTRSDNLRAQRVYEKFGFEKQNTIGKIFRDDQPEEIIMTRFFN